MSAQTCHDMDQVQLVTDIIAYMCERSVIVSKVIILETAATEVIDHQLETVTRVERQSLFLDDVRIFITGFLLLSHVRFGLDPGIHFTGH